MSQDQRQKHIRDWEPLFSKWCWERCDHLSRVGVQPGRPWAGAVDSHHCGKGAHTEKVGWARTGGLLLRQLLSHMSTMCSLGGVAYAALQLQHYSHVGDLSGQAGRLSKMVSVYPWSLFAVTLLKNAAGLETAFSCSPSLVKLQVLHPFSRSSTKPELPLLPVCSSLLVSNDWHINKPLKQFFKGQ